mgnify:CR=1 FL=1
MNRNSHFAKKLNFEVSAIYSLNDLEGAKHRFNCQCSSCSFKSSNEKNNIEVYQVDAKSSQNFQSMADYLVSGFWSDTSTLTSKWNLGSAGSNPKSRIITYNLGMNRYDSNGLTTGVGDLYRESFKLFEETLGIDFQEITYYTTSSDLVIVDNYDGAFAGSISDNGINSWAYINISNSWTKTFGKNLGTYSLQTVHHEIGHTLGLGHQGNYNGSASYSNDAKYLNDSWQASMMSYFSQSENNNVVANRVYLMTPSAVDWIALDDLYSSYSDYGVSNAFIGDTIYGFNTNISSEKSNIWNSFSSMISTNAYCIVDGFGNDTLDLSGLTSNNNIDLRPTDKNSTILYSSDIGGLVGNLHIAADTYIENCITGSGNDEIIGNNQNNNLQGGAGDDSLNGGDGNDALLGNSGNDFLSGEQGVDQLYGGDGNDALLGNAGNDRIAGENGVDSLHGGDGDDTLFGGSEDDILYGDTDNDSLTGGSGADSLFGGSGADTFFFTSTDDSGIASSARDIIKDFSSSESDKIDLSAIDANINLEGDQEFTFIGSTSFTNLGHQARFSDGILYLTTDGDADAEMAIELANVSSLSSSDFIL